MCKNQTNNYCTEQAQADVGHGYCFFTKFGCARFWVSYVVLGQQEGADDRNDSCCEEATVDWLQRVCFAFACAHCEHTGNRCDHADGASGKWEYQTKRWVKANCVERSDTQDDRGNECYFVAFEQVGSHTGTVAHVVAHIVCNGCRVAWVVFWDSCFNFAHQVGAHVGCLGEDAAANAEEQCQQRTAEAEANEHC